MGWEGGRVGGAALLVSFLGRVEVQQRAGLDGHVLSIPWAGLHDNVPADLLPR